MMSSCIDYKNYANDVLAKKIDPEVVKEIKELEKNNEYTNPRYM